MKIAVFSDVHGNRFALEAVLQDISSHKPDLMLNLGDTVLGGADPAGAL
jgi:predicted phosphodiesterase